MRADLFLLDDNRRDHRIDLRFGHVRPAQLLPAKLLSHFPAVFARLLGIFAGHVDGDSPNGDIAIADNRGDAPISFDLRLKRRTA